MATFTLSGSGTHAITAGTGALHVHVTTLPTIRGAGRAEPTNYYDLGLLRLGDGTYWWPSIPIDAEFQLLGCPQGTLEIAYALFNGTELSVVEVAGANPLAGSRALEDLSDVLIAAVSDGQVLKWNAAASKWENGAASTVATLEDLTDVLIASVANGDVLKWNSSAAKWENGTVSGGTATLVSSGVTRATDLLITTSNVFVDVLSLTLAAGTWLLCADVQFNVSGAVDCAVKLWDGSTVYASGDTTFRTGTDNCRVTLTTVVPLGATTTVKISATGNVPSTATVKAAMNVNSAGNNATQLNAVQIA